MWGKENVLIYKKTYNEVCAAAVEPMDDNHRINVLSTNKIKLKSLSSSLFIVVRNSNKISDVFLIELSQKRSVVRDTCANIANTSIECWHKIYSSLSDWHRVCVNFMETTCWTNTFLTKRTNKCEDEMEKERRESRTAVHLVDSRLVTFPITYHSNMKLHLQSIELHDKQTEYSFKRHTQDTIDAEQWQHWHENECQFHFNNNSEWKWTR